jgi:putative glycosyltransferase (TIGR04372 family)
MTRTAPHSLRKLVLFALNATWAVPAILLIRIVRPWIYVRMGAIESSRIGHFVMDSALYLARQSTQSNRPSNVNLFYLPDPICNHQWARMVRRQLRAFWWVRYLIFFNRFCPGHAGHRLLSTDKSRDIHGILQKSTAVFKFTLEEERAAKAWLYRRGWKDTQPFVCVLVRDPAYLSLYAPNVKGGGDRWNYHSHRDSDIDTFNEAIQALLDRGYWVIRMGKVALKRVTIDHPRLIDYPFVEDKEDLLDIWLSSNCKFFVSTGTGIDLVPVAYKRPVAFINLSPLTEFHSFTWNVCAPKKLIWKESGEALTLKETVKNKYSHSLKYEQAGISVLALSAPEIREAVMECEQRVKGAWQASKKDQNLQIRFMEVFRTSPDFCKSHGYIHPEARMGSDWLRSMGDHFFAE